MKEEDTEYFVNDRLERFRLSGGEQNEMMCRVAERIDISFKRSIYSLLDLHPLRSSVPRDPRDNMPILGRCSLHMHRRFARYHGIYDSAPYRG
jgi:hypothetical protein